MNYENRLNRIKTTVAHKEPDKVPVIGLYETWAPAYAGETFDSQFKSEEVEKRVAAKVLTDFHFDGVHETGNDFDLDLFKILGNESFFVSEDKTTLQHKEFAMMPDTNDYDDLTKDVLGYTLNKLYKYKFKNLNGTNEQIKETLKKAMTELLRFYDRMGALGAYTEQEFGVPVIAGDWAMSPVDMLFDFYRGFKGISADVRRMPEKVIKAGDKLADFQIDMFENGLTIGGEFPYFFVPVHLPTFISAKQFEKIYWPSFKKMSDFFNKKDLTVVYYWEGDCSHIYDFMNELPKHRVVSQLEKADFAQAKAEIGENTTLMAGISTEILKASSKEKCLEETKKAIDIMAPGGGYLFATNKILLAPNDVNTDNFRAVLDFAHEYGRY